MAYQPSQGRTPAGAACIVVHPDDDDLVLMIQRTGAHGEGTWSFPGGWVEPGEEPEAAAAREVWEEVGLNVHGDLDFLGYTADTHPEGLRGLTLWFQALTWNGRPRSTNPARVAQVCWFSRRKLSAGEGPGKLFVPVLNGIAKGLLA